MPLDEALPPRHAQSDADSRRGPGDTARMQTLLLLAAAAASAPQPSTAPPAPMAAPAPAAPAAAADAVAICERAARQSLTRQGALGGEVKFAGNQLAPAGEGRAALQGSGTWRNGSTVRRFDYSCNVDLRSPETVGVVLRDTTPAPAEPKPAAAPAEPDLSFVSPAACESAAAAALQKRWPRVSQIAFDPATRSLVQDSVVRAVLRGQGRALPGPGLPTTHFSFDCELDPRDGRVLATKIGG